MARSGRRTAGAALVAGLALVLLAGRAQQPLERALTFGVISDVQFALSPPVGGRFYTRSRSKLGRAADELNRRGVRFVIHLGDLIDSGASSYDLILPAFKKLTAPIHFVLGNHDFDVEEAFKPQVMSLLGVGIGYRAFTEGGWRFILLNGDELGFNFPGGPALRKEAEDFFGRLASEKRPNATKWNGGLSGTQMDFLAAEVEAAERSGQRVIVCCHFPVYPPAGHNLWNDREVVALLESRPAVKAYFSGHNHDGNYAQKRGLHFVTFRGLVDTEQAGAGAVITLTEDKIVIDGFGREQGRTLKVR